MGVAMKYELDGITYLVEIVKKNNKNTYIRVKDDMTILVTTSHFTSKSMIRHILDNNVRSLRKMLDRQSKLTKKKENFFYLGKPYDIIEASTVNDVKINKDNILVPNRRKFDKWYKEQLVNIFTDRLDYNFQLFDEISKCPTLKIRNMKTRWGVYNRVKHTITLNSQLLEYDIDKIDYVIVHELSHVIHFNHSGSFWSLVSKYCPDYKTIRKQLKE